MGDRIREFFYNCEISGIDGDPVSAGLMHLEVERVDLNPLVRERESNSALRSSRSTFQSIIRLGRIENNCMSSSQRPLLSTILVSETLVTVTSPEAESSLAKDSALVASKLPPTGRSASS